MVTPRLVCAVVGAILCGTQFPGAKWNPYSEVASCQNLSAFQWLRLGQALPALRGLLVGLGVSSARQPNTERNQRFPRYV